MNDHNEREKERLEFAFDRATDDLARLLAENLKLTHAAGMDAFDETARRLRSNVFQNMREFRSRFGRGYRILLERESSEGL